MFLNRRMLVFASALVFLGACSEPAQKVAEKKEEMTPDPPATGREAFQRMYLQARGWSLDAQTLHVQSYNITQVKSDKGKAGAWQAIFVTASKGRQRSYSWSAVEGGGGLHKGVFAGPDDAWTQSGQDRPFPMAAIKIDSDQAYETALKQKETAELLKKTPDIPVLFILEQTPRFPDVTWRVVFGESVATSGYSVFVDASTGQFLQKAH
jgi:hypothetical protein